MDPGAPEGRYLADQPTKEPVDIRHDAVQIKDHRLDDLLTTEGEELARHCGGALTGELDLLEFHPMGRRVLGPIEQQRRVADDHGQKVVEVVGDAARASPDGLRLLGMEKLLLGPVQLRRSLLDPLFKLLVQLADLPIRLLKLLRTSIDLGLHPRGLGPELRCQADLLAVLLLEADEVGDVLDAVDEVSDQSVAVQDRGIDGTPEAFFEPSAVNVRPTDVVSLDGHDVGDTAQRQTGHSYSAANAQRCLDALKTAACTAIDDGTFAADCGDVYVGATAAGQLCFDDSWCKAGLVCAFDMPDSEGGTCRVVGAFGESCGIVGCGLGLYCATTGTCATLKDGGATCAGNHECATGFCGADMICGAAQRVCAGLPS